MTWEEKLIKIYTDSRERVMNELRRKLFWGFSTDSERSLIEAIDRELAQLNKSVTAWSRAAIQENFLDAAQQAFKVISPTAAMPAYSAFAGVHTQAISLLLHNTQNYFMISNNLIARQAKDRVREIGVAITTRKFGENLTWQQTRKALEADLSEHGFFTVPWRNGRGQMRLDSYADLVARTTTAEATNTGTINQMQEMGQGLVKISEHNTTCKVCAPRQGRVYRIMDFPAGDERNQFPHISKGMPRWPTYKTIHVSCRHRLLPYIWSQKTEQEQRAALNDAGKPFAVDPRGEAEIKRYDASQKKLADRLRDRKQWEKYKVVLKDKAPTFSGFRAMKKADSEKYNLLRLDYRRQVQLQQNPDLVLPNAKRSTAADEKFTGYLFNKSNPDGWAKGVAFTSRLGYNVDNWKTLQKDILASAPLYPTHLRGSDMHGASYEQKVILSGLKGTPANVVLGWKVKGKATWLTTAYIKEVTTDEAD